MKKRQKQKSKADKIIIISLSLHMCTPSQRAGPLRGHTHHLRSVKQAYETGDTACLLREIDTGTVKL